MKKYGILALSLMLAATMMTGCRRRDERPMDTSAPTVMPDKATTAATEYPTEHTTVPTTQATTHATENTHETTNETTHENTTSGDHAVEETGGAAARGRHIPAAR